MHIQSDFKYCWKKIKTEWIVFFLSSKHLHILKFCQRKMSKNMKKFSISEKKIFRYIKFYKIPILGTIKSAIRNFSPQNRNAVGIFFFFPGLLRGKRRPCSFPSFFRRTRRASNFAERWKQFALCPLQKTFEKRSLSKERERQKRERERQKWEIIKALREHQKWAKPIWYFPKTPSNI